jgi:hypothetical protein
MSEFWNKKSIKTQDEAYKEAEAALPVQLDEVAMAELQEDPTMDIFDEEEEDTAEIMGDANLRLEQGRLYQMVLQGDIFADTNADPKAIRNVQREIRKFVRERMETMLGIRQEQAAQETVVSSPFNDLEVTVLKMLASKMSKGETEKEQTKVTGPELPPPTPKKDGISSISGNLRPTTTTPLKANPTKPVQKAQSKPNPTKTTAKSAIVASDETLLKKPIAEMSPQELLAYEADAAVRRSQNKSALPTNLVPHPSPQQLEMLYTAAAANRTIANPWRANGS